MMPTIKPIEAVQPGEWVFHEGKWRQVDSIVSSFEDAGTNLSVGDKVFGWVPKAEVATEPAYTSGLEAQHFRAFTTGYYQVWSDGSVSSGD